jgi:hypothetical protein
MRARILWALAIASFNVLAMSACSSSPNTARHTVADYRASAALRRQELDACSNDPGTLGKTPDCVNALEASRLEDTKSLRELPPIRLPDTGKPYAKDAQGR